MCCLPEGGECTTDCAELPVLSANPSRPSLMSAFKLFAVPDDGHEALCRLRILSQGMFSLHSLQRSAHDTELRDAKECLGELKPCVCVSRYHT